MNLVDFLSARITEDEAVLDALPYPHTVSYYPPTTPGIAPFYGRFADTVRVRAEIRAKRAIVEAAPAFIQPGGRGDFEVWDEGSEMAMAALYALAAAYADHPDYRDEWRP